MRQPFFMSSVERPGSAKARVARERLCGSCAFAATDLGVSTGNASRAATYLFTVPAALLHASGARD